MKLYAVYDINEDGNRPYIESYWLNYENAVARFKKNMAVYQRAISK